MDLGTNNVMRLLDLIVSGRDRTARTASELEGAILEEYPDADEDPRFQDLMLVLASFTPGGGEYLYNEEQLAKECVWTLEQLTPK